MVRGKSISYLMERKVTTKIGSQTGDYFGAVLKIFNSSGSFNHFSIDGGGSRRRFYINEHYGGCHKDTGWFVVQDQIIGCPWEKRQKRSPAILYGIGNKKVRWQSMVLSVFGSHPVTTNHIDCLGTLCDNHKAICHIILRHGGFLTVDRILTGQCISHCHYTMCHEHQVIPEHGCCCNDDHCVETIGQSHAAHASVLTTASTPTPLPTTTPVYCQNCQDLYNASCQTNGHTRCATGEACAFHRYASGRVETKCQLFSECETRRIEGIKYQSAELTKCCMDFDCVAKTVQIFSQGVIGSHPTTTSQVNCSGTLCDNHKPICHIIPQHGGLLTGQCINHCHYTMCHGHQVIPGHGCCCNDDHCVETIGQSHATHASVVTTASTHTPLPTTTPVYCQNCQDIYNASCQTNGQIHCATGEVCAFHRYASGRVETKCQLLGECETRRIEGIKYQSAEQTKCCMDLVCVAKTLQIFSQGALGSHPTTTSHVNCLGTFCDNHKPICHIITKHGGLLIGQCINHCHYTTCLDYQTVPEHGCCCQNDHCVETIGQSHAAHASSRYRHTSPLYDVAQLVLVVYAVTTAFRQNTLTCMLGLLLIIFLI